MAEGGCGARPLELEAVRDGDSEATAAAIEGDEAIVALGESCDCLTAIIGGGRVLCDHSNAFSSTPLSIPLCEWFRENCYCTSRPPL